MANDYAFAVEPSDEEIKALIDKGYFHFSTYTIMDESSPDYGRKEEMWIR
jgi:hypothetical protein